MKVGTTSQAAQRLLLVLALLLGAPACKEPEGDYRIPWEVQGADGEWVRLKKRTEPLRGDFVVRATLPQVKGPAPALHLWNNRFLVSATLDGEALPRAFKSDGYFLLPVDHAGRLLEVRFRSRGWIRYSRWIGQVGPAFALWVPWAELELPVFGVGALMVLLGVVLFAAGALRRGTPSPYAWLGLYLAPLGIVFVGGTRFAELLLPYPEPWRLGTGVAVSVFPVGLALFVEAVFGDGPRRTLRKAALACGVVLAASLASDLGGLYLIETASLPAWVVLLFIVVQSSLRVRRAAKQGDKSARAFLVGLVVAILFGLPGILSLFGVLKYETFMAFAPLGQLVFAFGMGLAIEAQLQDSRRRLADASAELAARLEALEVRNREVQSLNAELRRQVAERSRELEKAFGGAFTPLPGSTNLATGDLFGGRFKIVRLLGVGGMGAVYEVTRLSDGKPLALKVMTGPADAQAARRFAREAEIAARVQHERLVSVLDVGVTDAGTMFLAMELVPGKSLESERARYGEAAWALPLLADVAEGLAVLHAAGVVHRDLKPANVLLETGPSGVTRARISDFGIARWSEAVGDVDALADTAAPVSVPHGAPHDSLTRSGMMMGTPVYMAPELARGAQRAKPPSDVFGFGVLAWEVLTRHRPFTGPPIFFVLAGKTLELPAEPLPAAGPAAELIRAALEVEPSRRPTAEALATALRQAAAQARSAASVKAAG